MKLVFAVCLLWAVTTGALSPSDKNVHPLPNLLGLSPNVDSRSLLDLADTMGNNKKTPPAEVKREYWLNLAQEEVAKRVEAQLNTNVAKNVIFFLGDGMGLVTATAARIRKGQLKGNPGEEDSLVFQNFPYAGLCKTYCTDTQVADSACSSTAYLSGVKSNMFTVGVNARVKYNNCSASMDPANHVSSIAEWAQKSGKSTGIITTTSLTDTSPAGSYAHVANRNWQCDTDVTTESAGTLDPRECMDIAQQLITQEPGSKFNLMMGGGMGKFLPNTVRDVFGKMGERSDGRNLLAEWQQKHRKGIVVTDRDGLLDLNVTKVDNIMGLFQSNFMEYHALADNTKQPTLEEMTEVAINFLSQNDKGYFVFIEGARIDTANHENRAGLSLDETLEFDKAIAKARAMTDPNDTLIVVTADHSHGISIAGYPGRGTDILGLNQNDLDKNGLRYATLNYAAGPEQYVDAVGNRLDIEGIIDSNNPTVIYPSYIKTPYGLHSGEDVGVFASGPYEHLFRGVMEQNALPYLMAYASCMGDGPTACNK